MKDWKSIFIPPLPTLARNISWCARSTLISVVYFPALNWFAPESSRNHAVIPGHFLLSDARNKSSGPHILATKCHRVQKNPNRPRWESNLGKRQTLYHVAVKAGFNRKAVKVCLPIPTTYFPALNWFVPESSRNHAVIPGHFLLSDARNTSSGPHVLATQWVQRNPNRPRWESNLGHRI